MTKKIFSIVLAIIYLNLSIGLSLNAHFCHNEFKSINIFLSENASCCNNHSNQSCDLGTMQCEHHNNHEENKTHNNCCSDFHIEIKLETEQFYSNSKLRIKTPETKILFSTYLETELLSYNDSSFSLITNLKEPTPKIPLQILYSNFTFYG